MSAWDVAGAVVWGLLAFVSWHGALVPNKPPKPPYGETEATAFFIALPVTAAAVFCIARLAGAHA